MTDLLDRNWSRPVDCHGFFTAIPTQPSSSRSQRMVLLSGIQMVSTTVAIPIPPLTSPALALRLLDQS
jgi:hypothetical protein